MLQLLEHQLPPVFAMARHFRTRQTVKWGERDIHPPIVCNASVSSGKSIMIAALAKAVRAASIAREKPQSVLVLIMQRQGELCSQNSDAAWQMNDDSKLLNNSVFSASCGGRKSTKFQVVFATEGTVARALDTYRFTPYTPEEMQMTPEQRFRLGKFHPDLMLWDECHQVPFENLDSQAVKIISHFYDCKPHMRFAGFTGSPFRGTNSIIGSEPEFLWRLFAQIDPSDPEYPVGGVGNGLITTEFMIEEGWVVPPIFGYPDDEDKHYDFSHLTPKDWEYNEAELDAAVSDHEMLLAICTDMIEKAKDRKGVLVFAATQRHARQIAAAMKAMGIDPQTIGVITDKTKPKDRRHILDGAKTGAIKYTINVAVLTTGVNVPWWDTLVFMRPIGSLVLLIQAIGRVLRLLIQDGEVPMFERSNLYGMNAEDRLALIASSEKPNALVLDYADVMNTLGHLYENPVLEQAELDKAKKDKKELIRCPKCDEENSPTARRCIGTHHENGKKERCDWFWHFRSCPSCQAQNDQVARECRICKRMLIDPNAALNNKHYVDGESIPVRSMKAGHGAGGKLWFRYELSTGETPIEVFYPHAGASPEKRKINNIIWSKFVAALPIDQRAKIRLKAMKAETVMENIELIPVPVEISARKKGEKWTVGRRKYQEQEMAV